MNFTAIIRAISEVVEAAPRIFSAAEDVSKMVALMRKAASQIGTSVGTSNEELAALNATLAEYDADFDAAVAKRLAG